MVHHAGDLIGYNFLKAHPILFKMALVSTLTVGAFGRSGLLNALRSDMLPIS